jgi:hypothetical protein
MLWRKVVLHRDGDAPDPVDQRAGDVVEHCQAAGDPAAAVNGHQDGERPLTGGSIYADGDGPLLHRDGHVLHPGDRFRLAEHGEHRQIRLANDI